MKKGLFWVISDSDGKMGLLIYSAICESNGVTEKDQPAYNSKKGDSYSHELTWPLLTESMPNKIRNKAWNHFPRGRVEIANGKATVYYNPALGDWQEFEDSVLSEFELTSFPVRFIPDHSNHYRNGEDF